MTPTTLTMWLARDKGWRQEVSLHFAKPKLSWMGTYTFGSLIEDEDFGLRPGQCKKVKVTIEETK